MTYLIISYLLIIVLITVYIAMMVRHTRRVELARLWKDFGIAVGGRDAEQRPVAFLDMRIADGAIA